MPPLRPDPWLLHGSLTAVTDLPARLVDEPASWPVTTSVDLHRDEWVVALRADQVTSPSATEEPFRRLVLEHPGAVVVVAVDEADRVLCLRQYRHPARHRFVELPAGLLDGEDEDPLDVARRELREEAGLDAAEWTHLLSAYSSPGISSELLHYYLARDLTEVGRGDFELRHEEADMEVFWAAYADLLDAAREGRLTDAPTVLAVLAVHARGLVG